MTSAQLHKSQKGLPRRQAGFTLIELLVVIGILAVLLAIVLIAINPARQFAQANNTKRSSDVVAILNAISQYAADNDGLLPPGLAAGDYGYVGTASENICASLVSRYIAGLPSDPQGPAAGANITNCSTAHDTGYHISVSASDSRVTVISHLTQAIDGVTASIAATR